MLFLLHNFKLLSWNMWGDLWRFWPVLLVIAGINILWGARKPWLVLLTSSILLIGCVAIAAVIAGRPSTAESTTYFQALSGIGEAEINITFGAGDLKIGPLPDGSANLVESSAKPDLGHDYSERNAIGFLSLSVPTSSVGNPLGVSLDARFHPGIPVQMTVKTGASRADIDLSELNVRDLTLDIGASSLDLKLPSSAGSSRASIKAGAASLNITIPRNVAARIQVSSGLSSVSINSRFQKTGSVYQSADYTSSAINKLDLTISAGVSSINVQ